MSDDVSMIYFNAAGSRIGLDEAAHLLQACGLQVVREEDTLWAQWDGGPALHIGLSAAPHVAEEAAETGKDSPFAAALNRCDARFEIDIEDLDEVLDDSDTLIEVQLTLQAATQGYSFNSWNGELSGPGEVE